MNKLVGIFLLVVIFLFGAGLFFYESKAQKDLIQLEVVNTGDGKTALFEFITPEDKYQKIEIINNLADGGQKVVDVIENYEPGEKVTRRVSDFLSETEYQLEIVGVKESGRKVELATKEIVLKRIPENIILTTKDSHGLPMVQIYNGDGLKLNEFVPFGLDYKGGINLQRLDIDGDGADEVVVAPKSELGVVKFLKIDGELIKNIYPYGEQYWYGFDLAKATLDKTFSKEDLIVSPLWGSASNNEPQRPIQVYGFDSSREEKIYLKHSAVAFENFNGGVNVSSGDLNGDGSDEILATPIGGSAEVRVFGLCNENKGNCQEFYGLNNLTTPYSIYDKIFPFGKIETQDIEATAFDLDDDGFDELIASPLKGKISLVRVYKCQIAEAYRCEFKEIDSIQVYGDKFEGGLVVRGVDTQKDLRYLVIGPMSSGGSHIKMYKLNQKLELDHEFFVYDKGFEGGLDMEVYKFAEDLGPSLVFAPFSSGGPHIRIFDLTTKQIIRSFFAGDEKSRNSLRVY